MARVNHSPARGAQVMAAAVLLDLLLGDPPNRYHPVAWFGRAAQAVEARAPRAKGGRLALGAAAAVALPLAYGGLGWLLLRRARGPHAWALEAILLKSTFAVRGLVMAAEAVRRALADDDLAAARERLRALVSRDVHDLDRRLVISATVESLAENVVDSFVAPWLFYAIAGLPAALAYRALNTLDAMWGYRKEEYEQLGKACARLDDAANYVAATLSARLLLLAGQLLGLSAGEGARVLRRDGAATASPNAGRPMSAMAGLLGVQLERRGSYVLGDAIWPLDEDTIREAQKVVLLAAFLCLATLLPLSWLAGRHWVK